MKYEDIVEQSKRVKAPCGKAGGETKMKDDASKSIIGMLKTVDSKTRRSIRIVQGVIGLVIPMYLVLIILASDPVVWAGLGMIIMAFCMILFIQQLRFRAYSEKYLGRPTIEYLQSANKRMRVFTVRTWLVIPTWLLIDAGICLLVYAGYDHIDINISLGRILLALQAFLVFVIGLDFFVAYLMWDRNHRPAVDEINRMLGEIEASH
jgi:membrane protein YdbS with pleckstrin-like domain